jgi:hypothetical protein
MAARAFESYESGREDAPVGLPGGEAPAGSSAVFIPFRPGASAAAGGRDNSSSTAGFLRSVAYHEAGHTTVSRVLGLPVAGATINYIHGHHGLTRATDTDAGTETVADLCAALVPLMPPLFDDRADIAVELLRAHGQVVSLLAGPICEQLFIGEVLPNTGHDLEEAKSIAALICRSPRSVDAFIEFARCEARGLLADHADVVQRVAAALLERRTILAAEIDAIIADAVAVKLNDYERRRRLDWREGQASVARFVVATP